ncbi:MAG: enoyl-CoA hydratase/isomerase family protein [Pseudomonadota bacterium]
MLDDAAPTPETATDDILFEIRDGIGWLVLNRPQARNALTFDMYDRIAAVCEAVDADAACRALVISGAGGKAFAAGTDISRFREFTTPQHALDYESRIDRVLDTIERCSKPTLAAISGACTGGGAAIAACCDLRLATDDLKFGFPIARTLGNCLSAGNLSRLTALIGAGRTREILFTARLIGAEEARAVGLIAESLPDYDAVMARADVLAQQIAGHAPLTLKATKETLRRLRRAAADVEDSDLITLCYMSADFREGLEAFLAKRKPDWQGR